MDMMVTAETITDEQIRELRRARKISAFDYHTAMWGSWLRSLARARCADAYNARTEALR